MNEKDVLTTKTIKIVTQALNVLDVLRAEKKPLALYSLSFIETFKTKRDYSIASIEKNISFDQFESYLLDNIEKQDSHLENLDIIDLTVLTGYVMCMHNFHMISQDLYDNFLEKLQSISFKNINAKTNKKDIDK